MDKFETARLKGLAIIMIILYHLQYDLFGLAFLTGRGTGIETWVTSSVKYIDLHGWVIIGVIPSLLFIGVNLFFLISGYGLVRKYYFKTDFNVKDWFRQIWKIILPYWIALPVTHLINYGFTYLMFLGNRIDKMPAFFEIYLPSQYLESILVPSRWFVERLALNFVGTWWFVGIILQFYLLLPVLLWLLKKLKARNFIIIALLITFVYRAWAVYFTNASTVGVAGAELLFLINLPARLAEFALGMYFATKSRIHFFKHQTSAGILLIVAGLIFSSYLWGMIFSDFLISLGLFFLCDRLLFVLKRKSFNWTEWLGNMSYYIFLYHEPALKLFLLLFFSLPI